VREVQQRRRWRVGGVRRGRGGERAAAHEAIAEAVADSDVETTRKWMERHINDFRKGYEMSGFDIDRSVEAPTKEI